MSDEAVTFSWQQHPETRRHAREPRPPSASEHAEWMHRRIAVSASVTEILMHRNKPAGTLRLDPRGDALEVSIVVAPEFRRRGIGAAALTLARALRPKHELLAHILPANAASRALFIAAGYRQQSEELWLNAPVPALAAARQRSLS
jgi:L-amino acid N-acyltransferase YncA